MPKRILAVALTVLVGCAAAASATVLETCCACIDVGQLNATTSLAPIGPIQAAFCSEADSANFAEVNARCEALGTAYVLNCVPNIPGPTCQEQLARDRIICPTAAAPAAAPATLLAGAVVLSAIAAAALRRR